MLFAYKSILSVLTALVFSVGILYGQSEEITIRKDKDKGTTVILMEPFIYINQMVVNQQMGAVDTVRCATNTTIPQIGLVETAGGEAEPPTETNEDESLTYSPELDNVWNDSVQQGYELSYASGYAPKLSLKSNILQDAAYVPQYGFCPFWNVGLEYFPLQGHWSLGASLDIPWWEKKEQHKFFQARNWELMVRRYFFCNAGEYRRMYVHAYANMCVFCIGFDPDKAWQGEGAGAGLGIGYAWNVTKRWRIEAGVQLGVLFTQYDPFTYGDPIDHIDNGYYYYDWDGHSDGFRERSYRYTWMGPTGASISIAYNLFISQRQKGVRR